MSSNYYEAKAIGGAIMLAGLLLFELWDYLRGSDE